MPQRYNSISGGWEQLTFKVSDANVVALPDLQASATEEKKTLVHYGCGPAKWVYFKLAGQDNKELFVRTSVKSKETGLTTTYILPVKDGVVRVGHGMCSGAFHFDSEGSYEVVFQLFDESGNRGNLTNPVSFTKPTVSTLDE
jgi:hypothetical protein